VKVLVVTFSVHKVPATARNNVESLIRDLVMHSAVHFGDERHRFHLEASSSAAIQQPQMSAAKFVLQAEPRQGFALAMLASVQ